MNPPALLHVWDLYGKQPLCEEQPDLKGKKPNQLASKKDNLALQNQSVNIYPRCIVKHLP